MAESCLTLILNQPDSIRSDVMLLQDTVIISIDSASPFRIVQGRHKGAYATMKGMKRVKILLLCAEIPG
jgi:hypothetical protein